MRTITALACLLAATAGCIKQLEPTDVDTESDTDTTASCEAGEASSFQANYLDPLCRYYEGCPEGGFTTMEACRAQVRQVWQQSGGWDACLATECAEWLDSSPTCTRSDGYTNEACESMDDR